MTEGRRGRYSGGVYGMRGDTWTANSGIKQHVVLVQDNYIVKSMLHCQKILTVVLLMYPIL